MGLRLGIKKKKLAGSRPVARDKTLFISGKMSSGSTGYSACRRISSATQFDQQF
jgi:hypothetical protein